MSFKFLIKGTHVPIFPEEVQSQAMTPNTLISRGNVKPEELKVDEFICLLEYRIPAWPESRCSLCKDRIPINTDYGHGKEFVEKHKGDKVYKLIED